MDFDSETMMRQKAIITGKLLEHYFASVFNGLGRFGADRGLDTLRFWFMLPHPSEASIHPTDEDLSVGAPEMGRPFFCAGLEEPDGGSCYPRSPNARGLGHPILCAG